MSSQCSCLVLTVFGALALTGTAGQQCESPLGFEDGSISDDQLTASSSTSSYTASQARLHVGDGWVSTSGSDHPYLLVDLLAQFNVTSYTVQGASQAGFVNNFTLYYSNDNLTWATYTDDTGSAVLPGTEGSEGLSSHQLVPVVKARYLAIQPMISGQGLRIELYGCRHKQQEGVPYTLVNGQINDNEDWVIEGSPYVINFETEISATARVRIHEGVKVVFNSSRAGLNIYGTVEATGTDFGHPLPFAHAPNQWLGLILMDQGTIVLDNCSIAGARTGLSGALASMEVRNCRVFENNVGIHLTEGGVDGSAVLSGTTISGNSMEGILLDESGTANSWITLDDCQLLNNGNGFGFEASVTLLARNTVFSFNNGHGISNVNYSDFSISIILDKCFFEQNARSGVYLLFAHSSSESSLNLTILNSTFERNKDLALFSSISHSPELFLISIKNSYIIENSAKGMHIELPGYGNGRALIDIVNNRFVDIEDKNPSSRFLVFVQSWTTSSFQAKVTIKQNIFLKGIAMQLQGNNNITYNISNNTITTTETWSDAGVIIRGGEASLEGNSFVNCTTRIVIKLVTPSSLYRNIFINPEAEYDLFVKFDYYKYYSEIINASFNYWGATEPRTRIRDFFMDSDLMFVDIEPMYTTPDMDEIQSDSVGFSSSGGVAGGLLFQDVVIGPHENLLVKKGIYVPEGLQLTILEGVTLTFELGTGIHVKGSLDVKGELSSKVVMQDGSGLRTIWNGLWIEGTDSSITNAVIRHLKSIKSTRETPTSFTLRDTVIDGCYQAFFIRQSKEFKLTLNVVEIRNCNIWMSVELSEDSTATVDIDKSVIDSGEGMFLNPLSTGHLNISIHNSRLHIRSSLFSLLSCSTDVSLRIGNASLTKQARYSNDIDIMSSTVNIHVLGLEAKTRTSGIAVQLCPIRSNTTTGVIEVRDSHFVVRGFTSPLNINTQGHGNFNPLDVRVINNTFTSDSDLPSVAINTKKTIAVIVSDNTFNQLDLTIDSDADYVHLKKNVFNGRNYKIVIHSSGNAAIALTGNELNGHGQLSVSENGSANMHIDYNILKYASVKVNASNVNMSMNIFEGGTIKLGSVLDGGSTSLESLSTNATRDSESGSSGCTVTENLFQRSLLMFSNPHCAIHRNQFFSSHDWNLQFVGYCYAELTVNCSHNYWDTPHDYAISTRIYDSTEDQNLPVITFKPFYLNSNFTALKRSTESSEPFISSNGSIGGRIGGHVTLTANRSPYTVIKDILVEKLESLTLEAGVTLLFPRYMGIRVLGKLRVLGNSSHPVYAKAKVDGEKWSGVSLDETKHRATPVPEVRLVGECPRKEGRVEVKMGGGWRPVCREGFDQQDVKVVCSGLGYNPDQRHKLLNSSLGAVMNGTDGVVFHCDGTEGSLLECPMVPTNCSNQPSAYLRCEHKLLHKREDIGYEVEINHFIVNDTANGIVVQGNVSDFNHVESSFSLTSGITLQTRHFPSKISGLTVTNNNYGIDFPNYDGVDRIELSNCTISLNDRGVMVRRRVTVSFENCHFEGNDETVYLRTGAVIAIRNSTLERNNGVVESAVGNHEGELSFSLINSVVSRSSDETGIMLFRPAFTRRCTFEISNNIFSVNSGNLIYFSFYGAEEDSFVYIRNNSFVQNSASILDVFSPLEERLILEISNNVITGNTLPDSLVNMNCVANRNEMESFVNISGNEFSNNVAQSMIDIDARRSFHSRIDIVNNRFINNNCTTTVKVSSFEVLMRSNVLKNPGSQCELEHPVFRRSVDIDARYNYWGGSTLEGDVSGRICGFHANMSKGFILYIPYHDSEELEVTLGDTRDQFWTESRQTRGGLIESKLFIENDGSPYIISRSVYIRNGGELHLASGVELRFKAGTGIYVDGALIAQAESTENIVFRRADNSPWYGVVFPLMLEAKKGTARLVDHSEQQAGRVEMCINGTWTRVCEVQYPDERLICRNMGYEFGRGRKVEDEEPSDEKRGSVRANMGCKTSMWSLSQCQPTLKHNISTCSEVRVRCYQNIAVATDHPESYLEGVSILDSQVGLVISTQTVRLSNCYINNTVEAGLTLSEDFIDVDLNGTMIEHGQSDGILVKVEKYFNIRNGVIRNNRGKGMNVRTFLIKGNIEGILFIDNRVGLELAGFTMGDRFLIIKSNVFRGQDIGLVMDMAVHDSDGWINIINNEFEDNKKSMDVRIFGIAYNWRQRMLHVQSNNFTSSGENVFMFENRFSLFFDANIARDVVSDGCFLSLNLLHFDALSVSANQFKSISAKCVVEIAASSTKKIEFDYNSITRSNTSDATVLLEGLFDAKITSFSYNVFENPDSPFDLKLVSQMDTPLNASNNWWSGQNETEASYRAVDNMNVPLDSTSVELSPVLSSVDFDCPGSVECNNRGRCVGPAICWCRPGFAGGDCSTFDCSGVWNCSSHGKCIGPNLCQCQSGWGGISCGIVANDDRGLCSNDSPMLSTSSPSTIQPTDGTPTTSQPDVSGAEAVSLPFQFFFVLFGSVFMFIDSLVPIN